MTTTTPLQPDLLDRFIAAIERLPGVRLLRVALPVPWTDPRSLSLEPGQEATLHSLGPAGSWRELPVDLSANLGLFSGLWWSTEVPGVGHAFCQMEAPSALLLAALDALVEAWALCQRSREAVQVARGPALASSRRASQLRSLMDQAVVGIYRSDPAGRLSVANAALARLLGYADSAELLAQPRAALQFYTEPGRREHFLKRLQTQDELHDFESELRRRDGSLVWVSESARAVRDPKGRLRWIEGMVFDVSRRRFAEEQMRQALLQDPLTGLPNRSLLLDRLWQALKRCRRDGAQGFAVMVVGLDRVGLINETLGHAAGDAAVIEAGLRLTSLLRPGDTVGRLGGTDFVLLLEGVERPEAAVAVADRVLATLAQPLAMEGAELPLASSQGVALAGPAHTSAEQLLRDAATALQRARTNGAGRCEVFDPSMQAEASRRLAIENGLKPALDRGEIRVVYQPIFQLPQACLAGFEALARWQHPRLGAVSPDCFIAVAEASGQIVRLGAQVLEAACEQAALWSQRAGLNPFVSVNLSARQLRSMDLHPMVSECLARHGMAPERLKLEVTESLLIEDPGQGGRILAALAGLGCPLWLDDFGTGYSSLAMLTRFPFQGVKLDRSLVRDAGASERALELLEGVLTLARRLGLQVVAEGVEDEQQAALLARLGCGLGQGYLWSRPLEASDALRTLLNDQRPAAPL